MIACSIIEEMNRDLFWLMTTILRRRLEPFIGRKQEEYQGQNRNFNEILSALDDPQYLRVGKDPTWPFTWSLTIGTLLIKKFSNSEAEADLELAAWIK